MANYTSSNKMEQSMVGNNLLVPKCTRRAIVLFPSATRKSTRRRTLLYLSVFSANLLAFLTGVSLSWSSPTIPRLQNGTLSDNPFGHGITLSEASWLGGFCGLGGIIGPLLSGYTLTKFGRKMSAILVGILFSISFFTLTLAESIYIFYAARFVVGVACSCTYTVVPIYNGEVAETTIRGKLCASISSFEAGGELLSYVIGPFLTVFWFNMTITIFSIFSTILCFFILPESPFYLTIKGNIPAAEKSLMKLRSSTNKEIQEELKVIMSTIKESQIYKGSIKDIFKSKGLMKAHLTIFGLMTLQSFSGIMMIILYLQSIFEASGTHVPPEYSSIIVGSTKIVASFITPFFVDRVGRRPMLVISGTGMCISQFILGCFFFLKYQSYNLNNFYWMPIVCLVTTVFSFIIGFGPLLWTILGEIIPSNMKALSTSLTGCVYWFLIFLVSKMFELIASPFGITICFWFFSGICLLSVIFVVTYVIETKGKTFQEIQDALCN